MAGLNGSGTFVRAYDFTDDRDAAVKIRADRMDTEMDNIASALSKALYNDGQQTATGNQPMGGYRHTNVADASARTHYLAAGQLQDGEVIWLGSSSGTDTITASATPTITAYVTGMTLRFFAGGTNTGATTIDIDSVGAKTIQKNGVALVAGDITANDVVEISYDGTQFQMLSPARTPVITAGGIATAAVANNAIDETKLKDALVADFTEVVVTASDSFLLGDADDSGDTKRDTVQGILDLVPLPRSYLAGLGISNGTDTDHDIDIAAGECRDAADSVNIALSAITKQIDATWASGTNAGGLSSSLSAPGNNTWYHVFAIVVSGTADVGFDTSLTAANLVADHSATAYRRIGSILTDGSANIVAFVQSGDNFYWDNPPLDVNDANGDTTGATGTLTVPTGVRTIARVNIATASSTVSYIYPTDITSEAPSVSAAPLATAYSGGAQGINYAEVLTDTSAQIGYRTSAPSTIAISTLGWTDRRGRDD